MTKIHLLSTHVIAKIIKTEKIRTDFLCLSRFCILVLQLKIVTNLSEVKVTVVIVTNLF